MVSLKGQKDLNIPLELVRGVDRIEQHLLHRLSWYKGEWAFDIEGGTPWISDILENSRDTEAVARLSTAVALQVEGVVSVEAEVTEEDPLTLRLRFTTTEGENGETEFRA